MDMMRSLLPALLLVTVVGGPVAATDDVDAGTTGDPVYVDSTDILYLESYPVQVRLVVHGSLPTPCHQPAWDVQQTADGIDVRLWSTMTSGAMCTDVLEPVDVSIPLGSFGSADLPVTLNGDPVGRVTVGEPSTSAPGVSAPELVGAGWSYGMCAGFCVADLVISGDDLVLTGSGHRPEGTLFEHAGRLTPAGHERLDAALAALGDGTFESTYGCPDCADGGATYLTLSLDGVATRHDMEAGDPPAELAALHGIATSLIDSLQRCEPSDLVTVAEDCVPFVR